MPNVCYAFGLLKGIFNLNKLIKMEITKTEHYIEVNGVDNNGEFKIRIQKDCSQLQMETEDDDAYIDVSYRELKTIRDAITEVLDGFGKADA